MTLEEQLERDEGKRNKPYRDSQGKLTIGIGRNLDDVGLYNDEIYYLLDNDIVHARGGVNRMMPWSATLDEPRRDVLVNMAFNLGVLKLMGFKNTLELVQTGRYDEAADAMLKSLWAKQVGPRAVRLSKQMKTGTYQ